MMDAQEFRESPFDDDTRYSDDPQTETSHSPDGGPASELGSPEGLQWIHDVILELVRRLSWWDNVEWRYEYPKLKEDDTYDEVKYKDWGKAFDTVNRIDAIAKGLQCELLTAMPSDELMCAVCERLQSVISMLREELQWVRSAAHPPHVGNMVWTPDQIIVDVKRAMKVAYEESRPGLHEVACKVAVRAAVERARLITHKAPTTASQSLGVVPADQDATSTMSDPRSSSRDTQEPWPPDKGWHFRAGEAAFLGVKFAMAKRLKGPLKVLTEARRGLTIQEIAEGVSHDNCLEPSTIRGYLSEVRTLLRDAFTIDQSKSKDAPIINKGRGEEALWSLDLESVSLPAHLQR